MSAPTTSLVRHTSTSVEIGSVVPADFPLTSIILSAEAQLTAMLPPGQTIERVLVELYNVTRKNPQLLQAKADQLVPALCDALSLGGVIGRDVYLAPFKNGKANRVDVTVMVDYKFEAELVCLAGGAKSIQAFNWYANELFDFQLGSGAFVRHKKLSPSARGAWVGSYAVADIGHGALPLIFIMFAEEVEALRMRSRSWSDKALAEKHEKTGPVEWYGPKSCVHRVVKLLPKKPTLRAMPDRIAAAERLEFGEEPEEIATVEPPDRQHQRSAPMGSSPVEAGESGQADSFDLDGADLDDAPEPKPVTMAEATGVLFQGKALGTLRTTQLERLRSMVRDRVDEEGEGSKHIRLLVAVQIVLKAREEGKAFEPPAAKSG